MIRLSEVADADFVEAAFWYEQRSEGLGHDFQDCVEEKLAAIDANPGYFGIYEGGGTIEEYHRALVDRFPYVIIFTIEPTEIYIHTIIHASREPGYWERR